MSRSWRWPAALGLYAFVWIELVYPHGTELGPVRLWCAVYVAVMFVGGALFVTLIGIPLAWLVWCGAWLWKAYRLIKGFVDLNNNRPMPV